MKKILLATTALATAALVAGAAGDAAAQEATSKAAERIKLGISGYHQQWGVGLSQDIKDTGPNTIKTNAVDQKHNSEICFIGQTTLDNGLTVGVNVQVEANTDADQIDESYLFLQGPSLGQLILGDENNAGYLLHVTAPDGGIVLDEGDFTNIDAWVNTGISSYFDTPVGTTNLRLLDNDSGKFTYITPRFAGLQAGVSYIPQAEAGGDNNNGSYFVRNGNAGYQGTQIAAGQNRYANGWAGGVNYTQQFGVIGLQSSGGVQYFPRSKVQPVGKNGSDVFAYNLGAQIAYGGFSVGGAFIDSMNKNTVQATNNTGGVSSYSLGGYSYTVGAAYEFGPYKIGLDYMYGQSPGVISSTNPALANNTGNDQSLQQAVLSGTWTMGPGIRLVGGVFAYDLQTDTPQVTGYNNQGVGAATAIKLNF
ncbi:porin [Defluviicoccus vanus]|uniref:Porin n=1 Tax=Defluviicoccus vanus TaxID=111831 RepID=A0A7H1N1L3_9PROT|nr:porin [Defluviicoccus vanus]QNT69599.1 porin [Defluviicoccus vanus]